MGRIVGETTRRPGCSKQIVVGSSNQDVGRSGGNEVVSDTCRIRRDIIGIPMFEPISDFAMNPRANLRGGAFVHGISNQTVAELPGRR